MAHNVIDSTGYRQAIVHLAWLRDDQVRHLLFGMIELRPTEFPDAIGCLPQNYRAKKKSRTYLHYRRFVIPAADAIEWYSDAANGNPITLPCDPTNPTRGDGSTLTSGDFVLEPPWPQAVTSNELPFAPDWMDGARTHFLFPQDSFPREIAAIIQDANNQTKLKEWLMFDLVDLYREYQGAMCVLAPNPVFRSLEKSHIDPPNINSAETVAYKIIARHGQVVTGLSLEIVNEHRWGRTLPVTHRFDNAAIAVLNFPIRLYTEGRSISHPEYGLLYWHPPAPLARSIHLSVQTTGRRKQITVPARSLGRPAEKYEVSELVDETASVIGESSSDLMSRIAEAYSRRSRRQSAKDQEQEWFYDTPREAIQYVRHRIGSARDLVLIVDPYFAGRELLAFGHAIRRSDVHLRILSSTAAFRKSNCGAVLAGSGSELQQILDTTFSDYSVKPEVRILGDPPAVHDRFLVVDGNVWFSGNSLSAIGERAGMIVRLPDPEPVIARLEAFWSQARTLADWVIDRAARTELPPESSQDI